MPIDPAKLEEAVEALRDWGRRFAPHAAGYALLLAGADGTLELLAPLDPEWVRGLLRAALAQSDQLMGMGPARHFPAVTGN